jgi:hypothetical protein
MVPVGRVHEVHNTDRDVALSLHVYSPPLKVVNTDEPVTTVKPDRARAS